MKSKHVIKNNQLSTIDTLFSLKSDCRSLKIRYIFEIQIHIFIFIIMFQKDASNIFIVTL